MQRDVPFDGSRKRDRTVFEDIAATRLGGLCRRFVRWDVLVGAAKQPERPTRRTKTHQQNQDARVLRHASTFPIEHSAFAILEGAFLPPAARIVCQPRLLGRQIRHNVPRGEAKAVTHALVDADVEPTAPLFPDADMRQELPGSGSDGDSLERCPSMGRVLDLGRLAGTEDNIPTTPETAPPYGPDRQAVQSGNGAAEWRQWPSAMCASHRPRRRRARTREAERKTDAIGGEPNLHHVVIALMARFIEGQVQDIIGQRGNQPFH